jgi:putative nucleotidyltransferase with HDIG domain
MKKRITIDELRPGMRIETVDRSWLETPFLRHRMAVTSPQQIEQLRACGVRTLEVVLEEGAGEGVRSHAERVEGNQPPGGAQMEPEPIAHEGLNQPPMVPFEEELPAAKHVYKAAKSIVEGAMQDVRMGRAINMEAVNQVVSDMIDSVLRNADALTSLSRLKRFDEYTFFHSVNTALLALSLGRALGLEGAQLHELGVGTLLHDIGKTKIPLDVLNKPGRFDAHEFELMKQHVMRGAEVLSDMTGLADPYLKPALEHHERVDGSGYPHRRRKSDLSQYGLIAAVVDIYDAITSDRCYHTAKPAHEALQFLYLISQKGHLDHAIVQRFIQVVGVYPVGSVVELNTGELAVVRSLEREAPLQPSVILVMGPGRTLLSTAREINLRQQSGTPHRSIATVKDPLLVGVHPGLYLDRESL